MSDRFVIAAICLLLTTNGPFVASAIGENAGQTSSYASGVHAYRTGDYSRAIADLSAAISSDGKDPRPYFSRGMAYKWQNKASEAQRDFKKGAELEAADDAYNYYVAGALESIQGRARLEIEDFRSAVQRALAEKQRRLEGRYKASNRNEPPILRPPKPFSAPKAVGH